MASQSPAFQQAVKDSRDLKSKPSDNDLLELYGLFKIGTGADFTAADKPGMFDLKGKAKYNAWSKLVEEGLSAEAAQTRYVAKIEGLKTTLGF